MADTLTVYEAARELSTSRQTIRNLLHDRTLDGAKDRSGVWRVRRKSVDDFLRHYGPLNGGRRRRSALAALQEEVRLLREHVAQLTNAAGGQGTSELIRERDDLRTRVVCVENALASTRKASELQQEVEAKRSEVIDHLLAALTASDRASRMSRQALETLEDAVAGTSVPGHAGKSS